VLHAASPVGADITLVFQWWHRQLGALFSSLCFNVILAIENIPTHVWSVDAMQTILGTSYIIFAPSPHSMSCADMSHFLVVAWAAQPDLIPSLVGYVVPELELPFVQRAPPLFLRASELIHSKKDILSFCAIITILEFHDYNTPLGSDDDPDSSSNSPSGTPWMTLP
jgi:hypothetical protein